jgi:hypothetical protein
MAGTDLKHTLIDQVASYALDPLGFVLFAFPWGEPGTELANATGSRDWQRELLAELGRRLCEQARRDLGQHAGVVARRSD